MLTTLGTICIRKKITTNIVHKYSINLKQKTDTHKRKCKDLEWKPSLGVVIMSITPYLMHVLMTCSFTAGKTLHKNVTMCGLIILPALHTNISWDGISCKKLFHCNSFITISVFHISYLQYIKEHSKHILLWDMRFSKWWNYRDKVLWNVPSCSLVGVKLTFKMDE